MLLHLLTSLLLISSVHDARPLSNAVSKSALTLSVEEIPDDKDEIITICYIKRISSAGNSFCDQTYTLLLYRLSIVGCVSLCATDDSSTNPARVRQEVAILAQSCAVRIQR